MIKNDTIPKLYKYLDICSGNYYNVKKICTFGRPLNFIVGSRSIGKSTSLACLSILNYMENGKKFIYTRRTKDEVLLTCRTFFDNAVGIINSKLNLRKIKNIEYKSRNFYIIYEDGTREKCGECIPLSMQQKYKSASYSDYNIIIYDEFIAVGGASYLGNVNYPDQEYDFLMSLYQTVDRGQDNPYRDETRIFCLGNSWTIYNPIFLSFNISDYIDETSEWIRPRGEGWVLHNISDVDATAGKEESNAFLLANQKLKDYAFYNKSIENDRYIEKLPKGQPYDYICTLLYDGDKYGIYEINSVYYIGKPLKSARESSLSNRDHYGNDLYLLTAWTEEPIMCGLITAYKRNRLRFCAGKAKNTFLKYFRLSQ